MRARLRFETRALAGYALLLILLAGGMALSIRRFAAESEDQIAHLRAQEHEITLVERLRWNAELIVSNGRGYILSGDPRPLSRIEAAEARFDQSVGELQAEALSPEGAALVHEVEGAAAAFRQAQEELIALRQVDRFDRELLPRRDQLERALDRLAQRKEVALRIAYQDARDAQHGVEVRLYALIGLLAAIGLVLAVYFTRRLGRVYHLEERAKVARDALLGMVAHDLRNPLNALMMKAELMKDGTDVDKMRRQAESIANVTYRMAKLINSMLDVATLEAGRFTVSPAPLPVDELLRDATELLAGEAAAKQVSLERAGDADDVAVHADRERVVQVLSNLVGNAVKFTPPGGTVTLEAHKDARAVHFTVSDTGPGIVAGDLPHLFDRFWKRETGGAKGTGLGLFIAKGIVEAHDGRIWAESTDGRGARFHFTLPVPPS